VPGSDYHRAKVYPGRILRQPGDHAREKQRFRQCPKSRSCRAEFP
jgi:hypothetical protein